MITGSHIPFDRNGYKTNSAQGELRKQDEAPVNARVALIRQQLYDQPYADSLFDPHGRFKAGSQPLGPERADARTAYVRRYVDFFGRPRLAGQRLLVYEHSAVGRDILVEILERLGARVIAAGRSETFVPIDTENIDEEQLTAIQHLAADAWRRHGPLDAVVSTDGDSDRPLILGVEPAAGGAHPQATRPPNAPPRGGDAAAPCRVRFAGGDLVGMVVAEYLGADAVVVPINCNDAIDRGPLKDRVEPKTRIGSPYVTAGMAQARRQGRRAVCGWEANGGFLTASDFRRGTRILKALPTRDAMLPILGVLSAMREGRLSLAELLARLPQRFSRAGLLRNFPRAVSGRILQRFAPDDEAVVEASFEGDRVIVRGQEGQEWPSSQTRQKSLGRARAGLSEFFGPGLGFGAITRLNYLDGVRIWFSNGDVAHLRPSGNADELRIYAVADTQARADAIVSAGIAEPEGILRRLERASVSRPPR
jgi:phosphomannomutase